MSLEYCFKCDEPTGCAGRTDDSHYNDDGEGPFCWRCWCEDENPRLYEQLESLARELLDARNALEQIMKTYDSPDKYNNKGDAMNMYMIAEQALKENSNETKDD